MCSIILIHWYPGIHLYKRFHFTIYMHFRPWSVQGVLPANLDISFNRRPLPDILKSCRTCPACPTHFKFTVSACCKGLIGIFPSLLKNHRFVVCLRGPGILNEKDCIYLSFNTSLSVNGITARKNSVLIQCVELIRTK